MIRIKDLRHQPVSLNQTIVFAALTMLILDVFLLPVAADTAWEAPVYAIFFLLTIVTLFIAGISITSSERSYILFEVSGENEDQMTHSSKKASTFLKLFLLMGVILITFNSFVKAYNTANELENHLIAARDNSRQILGNYTNEVLEVSSVPDKYANNMMKLMETALSTRYGEGGVRAAMLFISEQNGDLGSEQYQVIQEVMIRGRRDFRDSQTEVLKHKAAMKTFLGYLWSGTLAKMAGYPHVNLESIEVVTSQHAADSFKSGIDKPVLVK